MPRSRLSTALDAARSLADVVLLSDSLMPVREALAQSRKARSRMGQNMALALGLQPGLGAAGAGRARDATDRGDRHVGLVADGQCQCHEAVEMNVLVFLIPVSVTLGLLGLGGFVWTLRSRQYEDPEGDRERILDDRWDDTPKP